LYLQRVTFIDSSSHLKLSSAFTVIFYGFSQGFGVQ